MLQSVVRQMGDCVMTCVVPCITEMHLAPIYTLLSKHGSFSVLPVYQIGSTRRIGIAIRYCGAYIKQKEGIGDSATLVCGQDYGNFPLEPVPKREFGEDEVKAHLRAVGSVGPQELIAAK